MQLQRTTTHTKISQASPKWHVIDAEGQRLGRLATKVAQVLQGKHKPDFSRHQITGDFVIVVNASRIEVSGKKLAQKQYYWHSGYQGSLRTRTLEQMMEKHPDRVIEKAVKGMLPRNRLGRHMLTRLKVYGGPTHPHEAQVNAGQGKPKQAPVVATSAPRTRTRRSAPAAAAAAEAAAEQQAVAATEAQETAEAVAAEETQAEATVTESTATAEAAAVAPQDEASAAEAEAAAEASTEASDQAAEGADEQPEEEEKR